MTASSDNALRDRPTGELLKDLSDHTTTLVKQEMELAKAELQEKGKQAGLGAGMFGGAGLFGLGAFAALTACLIAALDQAMEIWLAALVVAVAYAVIAAVLAITGKQKVKQAVPPVPEQAAERAERLGGYLHEADGDRILRDVEDFGRRNPWAVVAGGMALGFMASRLLKASSTERYRSAQELAQPQPSPLDAGL